MIFLMRRLSAVTVTFFSILLHLPATVYASTIQIRFAATYHTVARTSTSTFSASSPPSYRFSCYINHHTVPCKIRSVVITTRWLIVHDENIDPSQVSYVVSTITVEVYFEVAVVIVLAYDIIITIDKEVRYFWKIPRKAVDFVYFANRYVGLFGAIARPLADVYDANIALCNYSSWGKNISNWVTLTLIDYILMIRVFALYSEDRRLFTWLGALLALDAAFKLGMVIYLDVAENIAISYLGNIAVCDSCTPPEWQWGVLDWSIPMVYGFILMLVALYKGAEYWRLSSQSRGFSLVKILMRDQIAYFVLVIACCTLSILSVLLRHADGSYGTLSLVFSRLGVPSFLSILGSRLLFNLKEAGERSQYGGTSVRTQSQFATVISIAFADPENNRRATDAENATQSEGNRRY